MNSQQRNRLVIYISVALPLLASGFFLGYIDWQGGVMLHTVMETIATLLAFFVGVLALIRYLSQEDVKFLYIGSGFLGTAVLDAYHTIVTAAYFQPLMPTEYAQLVPWSWNASRVFLSLLMCVSWALSVKVQNNSTRTVSASRVFWLTGLATVSCFLIFTTITMPSISVENLFIHRPFEFISATFFLIALLGYLRKGLWRNDEFELWLVLSLIVGFAIQAVFMPFSAHINDTEFNVAHLLKQLSYICVLIGLLVSLYKTYIDLRRETQQRVQLEQDLRATALYTRSLIEASLDPLVTINAEGKITDANSATEQVIGIKRDKLAGSDFADYFTEPEKAHAVYQQVFSQGSVTDYPLAIRHVSGKVTEVLYNANIYRDEKGNVIGAFAAAHDVTERKAAELKLRMLSTAVEQSPTSVVITNLEAEIEYVNPCFTKCTGYTLDEVVGKNPRVLQSGLTQKSVYDEMWAALNHGQPWVGEFVNKRKNGEIYYEEAYISPVQESDGTVSRYVAVKLDVSERKQAQAALRESHENMHSLLHSMAEGAYGVDINGDCTFVNNSFLKILGYEHANEILGKHTHEIIHHSHADGSHYPAAECRMYAAYQRNQEIHCTDEVFWRKDGKAIPVEYWSEPIVTDGVIIGAIATFVDITERKKMEEEVRQLAFYDSLTKLPNRRLFNDRLNQTITASKRRNFYGALMFLDLDNFKPLNDTHGHVVGDMLLIEVASRIKNCIREMDTVARFGGDEFVVMLSELDANKAVSISQAAIVAEKIRAALAEPYRFTISHDAQPDTTVEHRCTSSIGVVVFNGREGSQDDVLKWADAAMYEAKDAGCNRIQFYSEKL